MGCLGLVCLAITLEPGFSLMMPKAVVLNAMESNRRDYKHRKVCLPDDEYDRGMSPGSDYPVFNTRVGRISVFSVGFCSNSSHLSYAAQ
jgi:hypothetical protein